MLNLDIQRQYDTGRDLPTQVAKQLLQWAQANTLQPLAPKFLKITYGSWHQIHLTAKLQAWLPAKHNNAALM